MLSGILSGPLDGPRSFFVFWRLLDRRAWALFVTYLLVASGVVAGFAALALALGPELERALLAYVFPEHWRLTGRMVYEKLFDQLGRQALANFVLNGGMAAISVTCFAVKEILSRRIEQRNRLTGGHEPWPLWRQLIEEIKFAVLYLLAYNIIFWLSYPPIGFLRTAGTVLSYLILFVFFNITFTCPLFLRHRIGYAGMVRVFFARPLASFGYALVFCGPAVLAARLAQGQSLSTVVALQLGIHVLLVAPAASAGTWLAARLLPAAKAMRPTPLVARLVLVGGMLATLAVSVLVFARLADSVHAKSQLLKCRYRVDWSSFQLELPSFSDLSLGLSFDLEIENPTHVDVRVEDSRLVIRNDQRYFSTVELMRIEVPAGQSRRQKVALKLQVALSRLLEYKTLVSRPWDFVLWVEVAEGWEFPVYFR
ncbi:MAG: hypothetical protein JXR96_19755 [Deltaproteobacteria bacterium]|nr:hypothetical protein [Deltaproteobacteria bacterium]